MHDKWTRYWIFQLIGWGSFSVISTFFAFSFDRLNPPFFYRLAIFVFLGVICSHLMREVIKKLGTLQKAIARQITEFVILTVLLAIVVSWANVEILTPLNLLRKEDTALLAREDTKYWVSKIFVILWNASSYFLIFFIWSLIYFVYHYISKSQKQQLDTLKLESLVKELELKTIKAHINPHFIFNSLNSIRALVDENPQRARKAVTELSNILRNSLQTDKLETVPLEKELSIVKDYLALENMRFEDRLKIEYAIDEDTLDQPVPPMMLQTLVENAIKHGISKQINGGIVKVSSDFKDKYHELSVQNTGFLNGHKSDYEGFGLSSTTNRLGILYGEKAKFVMKQLTPSLVEAKVMIPVYEG